MKSFLGFLAEATKPQKQAKKTEEPQQQKPEVNQADLAAQEEGEFGTFANGAARRMSPPTRADGSPNRS